MNKALFISYLDDQGKLDHNSIDELEELVEQYPYFQTARLLYLKSLRDNNSISFPAELKTTSIYAGNRTKLLKLMKQKTSSGASKDQQTDTDSRASKDTDVLSKFVEPLLFEHIATTTPGLTVTMVDRMLEFEYEQRKTSQEERNPKNKSLQHDLLQPQIIEYLQDEDKKENKPVQPNQNAKKQMNLIEKFIEKNPRIVPKESVPEVPHDLSEESVKENEFISETLADIYIKQKKYDKALQIYQKLSLKYPQKSIYFADQISKVEDFIKNDK